MAIPTPVIVDGKRLKVAAILLRFKTGTGAWVSAVQVWDGDKKIAWWDNLKRNGDPEADRFDVKGDPEVEWGLGISVCVDFFPDTPRTIHFIAAGCDFV